MTRRKSAPGRLDGDVGPLFQLAPVGLGVLDRRFRYVRINERLAALHGLIGVEPVGRTVGELLPELAAVIEPALAGVFERGDAVEGCEFAAELPHQPGGTAYWLASLIPLRDADGRVEEVLVGVQDVTQRRQAEELLRRAWRAAEDDRLAKEAVLAQLSHGLRAPLAAVAGWAERLSDTHGDPADGGSSARAIQRNVRTLLDLLDRVQDLTQLAAGKQSLACRSCSLWQLMQDVLTATRGQVEQRQLSVQLEYQEPLPAEIRTDPDRLRQVLVDMVGEAVKAAERGTIKVALSCSDDLPDGRQLRFAVGDVGGGGPAERMAVGGEPGGAASAVAGPSACGVESGLAIARQLAGWLGGRIAVGGAAGAGATFSLTLKADSTESNRGGPDAGDREAGPPAVAAPSEDGRGRLGGQQSARHATRSGEGPAAAAAEPVTRVVLADDDRLVRAGTRALIEAMAGFQVVGEAANGLEAVERAREQRPDLVLMDIGMPELDGLTAAAQLTVFCPDSKVVMFSVHAREECVIQAIQAGASGFLLKNMPGDEFERALRVVARGETYVCPSLAEHAIATVQAHGLSRPGGGVRRLTPRQLEVLKLIAEGYSTKKLAGKLGISVKTANRHRADLMHALGIHETAGLVRHAIRLGLVVVEK